MKRLTQKEVLERFKKVHGNKYDYSKVNYTNNHTKVNIICKTHGEWLQTPSDHFYGHGCVKCRNENLKELKYDLSTVIVKSINKFGDKYDYSLIKEYRGITEPITLVCNKHKYEIITTFHNHISSKDGGCRKCHYETNKNKLSSNTSDFIEQGVS